MFAFLQKSGIGIVSAPHDQILGLGLDSGLYCTSNIHSFVENLPVLTSKCVLNVNLSHSTHGDRFGSHHHLSFLLWSFSPCFCFWKWQSIPLLVAEQSFNVKLHYDISFLKNIQWPLSTKYNPKHLQWGLSLRDAALASALAGHSSLAHSTPATQTPSVCRAPLQVHCSGSSSLFPCCFPFLEWSSPKSLQGSQLPHFIEVSSKKSPSPLLQYII